MNLWRRNPFFRICLPFIGGIYFAAFHSAEFAGPLLYVLLPLISLTLLLDRKMIYAPTRYVKGVLTALAFLSLGAHLYFLEKRPSELALDLPGDQLWVGTVKDTVRTLPFGCVDLVEWKPYSQERICNMSVRIQTLIPGTSRSTVPGDRIVGHVDFHPADSAHFPGEFDEQAYLRSNGLFIQARLRKDNFNLVRNPTMAGRQRLHNVFRNVRHQINEILCASLPDKNHLGIMKALIIGDRSDLSDDIRTRLSGAGVTHVLAVSGLHVGIIYWILNGILGFLVTGAATRYLAPVIIIPCLAAYTLITGSSPSVIRASAILSILILARSLGLKGSSINTVLFTGFFMLCAQPHLLFNLSFQLSFLAVLGILWIYPHLKMWYYPQGFFPQKIIDLLYLSLSAQIATAPLTIARFHIFPTYSLLSNVVITPILILALYLGIVMVVTGLTGWLSIVSVISKAIDWVLDVALNIISLMVKLPWFTIHNIYIPNEYIVWIMISAGSVLAFLFYRSRTFINMAIISAGFAFFVEVCHFYKTSNTAEIIPMDGKNSEFLVLRSGRNGVALSAQSDTNVSLDATQVIGKYALHYRIDSFIITNEKSHLVLMDEKINHLLGLNAEDTIEFGILDQVSSFTDTNFVQVRYFTGKKKYATNSMYALSHIAYIILFSDLSVNEKKRIERKFQSDGFEGQFLNLR